MWTLRCCQVSEIVRGPCSLTMSKMVRVMVWVCSGGVFSSMGFIFGFPFFAMKRTAVANITSSSHIHSKNLLKHQIPNHFKLLKQNKKREHLSQLTEFIDQNYGTLTREEEVYRIEWERMERRLRISTETSNPPKTPFRSERTRRRSSQKEELKIKSKGLWNRGLGFCHWSSPEKNCIFIQFYFFII